jgi:hypothetical protein
VIWISATGSIIPCTGSAGHRKPNAVDIQSIGTNLGSTIGICHTGAGQAGHSLLARQTTSGADLQVAVKEEQQNR